MLTEKEIEAAQPREKTYRLNAGRGLSLLIHPNGGKYWRFRYRWENREKTLSLGTWPEIDLETALDRRNEARIQIRRHGLDPAAKRQAEKTAQKDTFEAIAREWLAAKAPTGSRRKTPPKKATIDRMKQRLEAFIFPFMGKMPIRSITVTDLKQALDRIADRGTIDTAHRVRSVVDRVYRYAIATDRADRNLAADLRGALRLPEFASFAAITNPKQLGALLNAIDGYRGQPTVIAALKLSALLFQRPGELRHAEWDEFDFGDALWSIPTGKMKNNLAHTVPLARQSVQIIEELRMFCGDSRFLFPSLQTTTKPISDNTLNAALRRMGYDNKTHVAHGFRTTASTLLHELGFSPDVIEQQLAHKRQGVAAVYNRSHLLDQRREMMQAWADFLDTLR